MAYLKHSAGCMVKCFNKLADIIVIVSLSLLTISTWLHEYHKIKPSTMLLV